MDEAAVQQWGEQDPGQASQFPGLDAKLREANAGQHQIDNKYTPHDCHQHERRRRQDASNHCELT